jgi:hypothetical protein
MSDKGPTIPTPNCKQYVGCWLEVIRQQLGMESFSNNDSNPLRPTLVGKNQDASTTFITLASLKYCPQSAYDCIGVQSRQVLGE